jgi:galactose mutarotase-like enzyme
MSARAQVQLSAGGLSASIDPLGAQLQSLRTADGQQLLWQGDPRYWPDRALILFPVIGPLIGNQFHHRGRAYPMPPHGFARQREFAVAEQSTTRCVFELRDDAETRVHYPFAFRLRVEFALLDDALLNTLVVENLDDEPLPADVGFHPGFNWPLTVGRAKDEYTVVFAEDEPAPIRRGTGDPVFLYPEGRPSPVEGNILRPRDELFEELAIVFDRLNSRSLTFGAPGALGLRVDFPDSPHLGLWMVPGATYLCIEPWQGYPSRLDFEGPFVEKPGIALIPPGETRRWRLQVTPQPAGRVVET